MTTPARNAPRAWRGIDRGVTSLASPRAAETLEQFLDRTASDRGAGSPQEPAFSEARIETLARLSEAMLAHATLRRDPASVAVAYWMRRAQTRRHAEEFARRSESEASLLRVPVGRVLHLAPANVDTLFLYSWALAFLCGNANVVRLSRERGIVVESILEVIRTVAAAQPGLAGANRFVTYEHDAEITAALSAWCSHRVIWGGNETVAALRPLPLNPHASERVFGSKFSYGVFASAAYRAAGEEQRARLAGAFFNDLFWFDQMACSSPHVLFWVGPPGDFEPAVDAFEASLEAEAARRQFVPQTSSAVQRRTFAFELAADADVRVSLAHSAFVGARVLQAEGLGRDTCGGGFLRHYRLDDLDQLAAYAEEGDQTVTHFGFDLPELRRVAARLGERGVDRVVPVGEALAFDPVWDGFDLIDDFTRRVRVK